MRISHRGVRLGALAALLLLALPAVAAAESALPVAPGTTYAHIYRPAGPHAIHVVEADLSQEYLEARALLGGGHTMGRTALAEMLATQASLVARPVAAVNGDFFALAGGDYSAVPLGLQVLDGELVTFPDPARSVLYVLADDTAHIDRFRANAWLRGPGDVLLQIAGMNHPPGYADLILFTPRFGEETRADADTTQFALVGLSGPVRPNAEITAKVASIATTCCQRIPPDGAVLAARGVSAYALRRVRVGDTLALSLRMAPDVGDIRQAVGGGPRLVRDGLISVEHMQERFADRFASRRHPRTGVGIRDGSLVLVTVDGRQPRYSDGMTLYELGELFLELGCIDAMNLDGGGSTTMVVHDRVVNSPASGLPRAVANGLGLFSSAPAGPPTQLSLAPASATLLCGDSLALAASGMDTYYNPLPVEPQEVRWGCAPALGVVDESGVFTAAEVASPIAGLVVAELGDLSAAMVMRVTPGPTQVVVTPARARIEPDETQQFCAHAYDEAGKPVQLPQGAVMWTCEPAEAGARIDPSGLLHAPSQECHLTVTAQVGDVCGQAHLDVGAESAIIEDFEAPGDWSYRSGPLGSPGAVERVEDPQRRGNHCLALSYDFSKGSGTRTAHAVLNLALPETRVISVAVLGDGGDGWLRARVRDAAGRTSVLDLAHHVRWSARWRRLNAWLPENAKAPVTLESIYLAEIRENRTPSGTICLDDIAVAPLVDLEGPAEIPDEPAPAAREREARREAPMEPPTYVCRRTQEPMVIDGHLSESVWAQLEPVGDFRLVDGEGEPQLPTEVRACWDDQYLYLGFVCVDTDIWGTMQERDDPIYEEEVVEAFISSCGDVTRYYEFNFSPHNVIFDAAIECPESGDRHFMKADVSWNCDIHSAVQVVGTLDDRSDVDERWTVEVALPFSQIGRGGRAPVDGETWRVNFYRIDRAERGEFSCWSPTLSDPPNFHVPARFGQLTFSGEAR